MPDLSPDTSVYRALAHPQGGVGSMDIGSLLGLVQASRNLQTQSGIAEAIRANPDDPQAAYSAAASNPNVMLTPEHQTAFTNAASARYTLNRQYYQDTVSALASLLSKPVDPKTGQWTATLDDWNTLEPGLAHMGVPQSMLSIVRRLADPRTGRLPQTQVAQIANYVQGNQLAPTREVPGAQPGTTQTQIQGTGNYPLPQPHPSAADTTAVPPAPTSASPTEQAKKDVDFGKVAADKARASVPAQGVTSAPGGVTSADPTTQQRYVDSVKLYNADLDRATQYQNETVPLQKMISIMRKAGPNVTGWGQDTWQGIKAAMIGLHLPVSSDDTKNYQELRKYMAQQITNAGGRSDYALFSASHANPNTDLLQQANLSLAQVLLGLRRKDQFAVNEFQRSGLAKSPQMYSEWRSHWDPNVDTTGFVWDQMSPEEQKAYIQSHNSTPEEIQRLRYSVKASKRSQGEE